MEVAPNSHRIELVSAAAIKAARQFPHPALLDVGCGNGWILERIAKEAGEGLDLFGIEPSEVGAENARRRVPRATILHGVLDSADLARQFDVVVCTEVIEHVESHREFVEALANVIATGGVLVLTTPNGRYRGSYFSLLGEKIHAQPVENWLTYQDFLRLFGERFEITSHSTFDSSFVYELYPAIGRIRDIFCRVRGGWRIWHASFENLLTTKLKLGLYHLAVMKKK